MPESAAARPAMGRFERYLSLWVLACILAGLLLGQIAPAAFTALARLEWAGLNLPGSQ